MMTEILEEEKVRRVPNLRFKEFNYEWINFRLAAKIEFISGYAFKSSKMKTNKGKFQLIKMSNVYQNELQLDRNPSYWEKIDEKIEKFLLREDDIILTLTGTVGKKDYGYSIIVPENNRFLLNQRLVCLRYRENESEPNFINNLIKTSRFYYSFFNESKGGTGNQSNVGIEDLRNIVLKFPTLPEQQKIAAFLFAVDKKIQQLTRKKELLETYKNGVMQQLFSQKIRFKDEDGKEFPEWKKTRVSNFIEEFKQQSTVDNEFEVLTSSNRGLMKQSEYFGENRLTNRDNKGFNVIPNGYLTYRSRSDNRKFSFNENTLGITGVISTYYPVFKMKNGATKFFLELMTYNQNIIGKYSVGTSQTVLSFNNLKSIKFHFPCDAEQQKIADFLSAIDRKIEAVSQQIEKTQTFKKGLLQQMFV